MFFFMYFFFSFFFCCEILYLFKHTKVTEYKDQGYFGELALLYDQPRSATIVCSSPSGGRLCCMHRRLFQRVVITQAHQRRKMYEEFLASVPLLKESMSEYQRSQVASSLTSRTYQNGECVFRQNDEANGIYFVEAGWVRIVQRDEEEDNEDEEARELGKLTRGDYFGELALVNKGETFL